MLSLPMIGSPSWEGAYRELERELPGLWESFAPCAPDRLDRLEASLSRPLPADFRIFYQTIGCGKFGSSVGGMLSDPEAIANTGAEAIQFYTGCSTPGDDDWTDMYGLMRLWRSRGRDNPNKSKFTDDVLLVHSVSSEKVFVAGRFIEKVIPEPIYIYNILPIGSNGVCCMHALHLPETPSSVGFCLLTDGQEVEKGCASFNAGIQNILREARESL